MTGLRNYQQEDLLKVKELYEHGERRLLGVAATGLGKTKLFSNIYQVIPKTGKMLVIVNREELVKQSVKAIQAANPSLWVGVEQAGNRSSEFDDVIVASIQTIGSVKKDDDGDPVFNKRLMSLNPDDFTVIIADEAHRAMADSWLTALKYFRVYKEDERYNDPHKLLLCLTATPNRADNKGLQEICDHIAFTRDIRWGIENNWLCDIEAYRVNTRVDISDVKTNKGDFDQKQLANKINNPKRNELVVEKYLEIAGGKKALFFTMDIAHAKAMAETLNAAGIPALAVYSGMKDADREHAFLAHQNGQIKALCGANIFLEGYDDPTIEVVCMVRPTKSNPLYTQAIGRGLRPFPAPEAVAEMRSRGEEPAWIKPACIVIDFVDVSTKHSLITVPTLFGLSSNLDLKGKKAVETLQGIEEEIKKIPASKQSLVKKEEFDDIGKLLGHIEKIDLLSAPTTPDEIKKISELSWYQSGSDSYILSTPEQTISVTANTLGNYSIFSNVKGIQKYLGSETSLEGALRNAEGMLDDNQYNFSKANAAWKQDKPSVAQLDLLCKIDKKGIRSLGGEKQYRDHVLNSFNKAQVGAMITEKMRGFSR